jgi:hypothetical protein
MLGPGLALIGPQATLPRIDKERDDGLFAESFGGLQPV